MSISVQTRDGRMSIHENGRLVIDKGGDYVDAVTNGKVIVALLKSGRVQEFRLDGQFVRDILGNGAVGINLADEVVVVTKLDGRIEKYINGRFVSSEGGQSPRTISSRSQVPAKKKPAIASRKGQSEAEKLGAAAADVLLDALGKVLRSAFTNAKEQLKAWRRRP